MRHSFVDHTLPKFESSPDRQGCHFQAPPVPAQSQQHSELHRASAGSAAGEPAPNVAFSLSDPLIPELLSWVSCAAILGGLAGSVAVASCCEAIGRAKGAPPSAAATSALDAADAPASPLSQSDSDRGGSLPGDVSMDYQQDTQAGHALQKASLAHI